MNNAMIWVFLLVGVAIVAFLLIAFARGRRIQARDSGPLHTDEPSGREPGPEPDPGPDPGSGGRLKPHQLKGYGNFDTRPGPEEDR
ncbi:DUF6479 family protein [Streptomyces yangpuensis]|uniref:DUF6479 family protein n=1 Tax=Streptomyces yangpuensis TaxID=1648182 RepID=UPI0034339618|nr:DUF6479 family protein [Streptomyces erythrochromogenes]